MVKQVMSFSSMLRREQHRIHHHKFSPDEDSRIINAVGIWGESNWPRVIQMARLNRQPRDVRERWDNYLDPKVGAAWTEDDDRKLQTLAEDHLGQWAYIASQIPGKSANRVRTRYRQLNRQRMDGPPPVITAEVQPVVPQLPDDEFEVPEVIEEYPSFPTQFDAGTTFEGAWPWDENPPPS
jgi:hypothetical protein